jgi:hypothetical protein
MCRARKARVSLLSGRVCQRRKNYNHFWCGPFNLSCRESHMNVIRFVRRHGVAGIIRDSVGRGGRQHLQACPGYGFGAPVPHHLFNGGFHTYYGGGDCSWHVGCGCTSGLLASVLVFVVLPRAPVRRCAVPNRSRPRVQTASRLVYEVHIGSCRCSWNLHRYCLRNFLLHGLGSLHPRPRNRLDNAVRGRCCLRVAPLMLTCYGC